MQLPHLQAAEKCTRPPTREQLKAEFKDKPGQYDYLVRLMGHFNRSETQAG